ncbi:hypothetical protein LguiB_009929 [Lonicera macranthoides]
MDGQKSPAKLKRTQSSLLRSSPTIRSSIHSLNSVSEILPEEEDIEEQKPHKPGTAPVRTGSTPVRPGSVSFRSSSLPVRTGSMRFLPVLALSTLALYTIFVYFKKEEIPTSENLLLALIFVAIALFFAGKNKGLIQQILEILKHFEYRKKLGLTRRDSKPVQWFIGDSNLTTQKIKNQKEKKRIVREGVEFYSNGDFYEGEFHKGMCNGSGVYNYFVNGRYEGDWIDGRYDGYGIESWAKGSRYRGQYRQGLRHGYGVYRFYTGDSYAGEWFKGQSHGVGVQTCSDGSCYVGEFKFGVKHGLGCYHFRNGDRYAGEYFGDKIHGFGVYHFANCHCYEGSWHEGRKQGYGMYTFRNGDTRCGEWDSGNLKTPITPLTDAVLRAVQAARKTADNTVRLHRVDEQVNKAVTAANRAATAARVAAVKAVQNRIDGKFCDTDI